MNSKLRETNYMTYIEPNYTASVTDTDGNDIMLTHDYEDYCVAVDLAIEIRGRHVGSGTYGANRRIVMHWEDADGKNDVSFFAGQETDATGGKTRILTSAPTEVFINDIRQNTTNNLENIGISSISIRYNSFMVPEVEIDFVDVRGGALFMPEEMRHHYVGSSGFNGLVDGDIEGSLFRSFFTFPYPKYTLTVKGFYGQPVSYMLSCSNFTSELNSQDGNFHMRATFVGFSFSFMNDVSYNAMICAPNSKTGGSYWDDHVKNGEFTLDDSNFGLVPMKKISDIIDSLKGVKADMETISNDEFVTSRRTDAENAITKIDEIKSKYRKVSDAFRACYNSNDKTAYYDGKNLYILKGNGSGDSYVGKEKECVTALSELSTAIKEYGEKNVPSSIRQPKTSATHICALKQSTEDGKWVLERNEGNADVADWISRNQNDSPVYDGEGSPYSLYSYDTDGLSDDINAAIKNANEVKNDTDRQIREMTANLVANRLGFTPNVVNMTKILMAHMETLISMIYGTAKNVSDLNNSDDKRTLEDFGMTQDRLCDFKRPENGEDVVPPFPQVSTGSEDPEGKNEDAWLGDIVPDSSRSKVKEIDLVEDLLDGVRYMKSVVDDYVTHENDSASGKTSSDLHDIYCEYPILPIDYLTSESPFGTDIDFNDWTDIAARCYLRYVQYDWDNNCYLNKEDDFGESAVRASSTALASLVNPLIGFSIGSYKLYQWANDSNDGKRSEYMTMCGVIDAYNLTKGMKLSDDTLRRLDAMTTDDILKILKRKKDDEAKDNKVYAWDYVTRNEGVSIDSIDDTCFVQGYSLHGNKEASNEGEYVNTKYSQIGDGPLKAYYIIDRPDTIERIHDEKYSNISIGGYDFTEQGKNSGYDELVMERYPFRSEALYNNYRLNFVPNINNVCNVMPKWSYNDKSKQFSYKDAENRGYILPKSRYAITDPSEGETFERFDWRKKYGDKAKNNGVYKNRFVQAAYSERDNVETEDFKSVNDYKEYRNRYSYTRTMGKRDKVGVDMFGDKTMCIFGQKAYYKTESLDEKALMFLSSCGFYDENEIASTMKDLFYDVFFKNHRANSKNMTGLAFELFPKTFVLLIGCVLSMGKEKDELYNGLDGLGKEDKKEFIKYYEKWVDEEFKEIDDEFGLRTKNNDVYTESDIQNLMDVCHKQESKGYESGIEFLSELEKLVSDKFFKNYECVFYGDDNIDDDSDGVLLYFREGEELSDKMTELMMRPVLVCRPFRASKGVFFTPNSNGDIDDAEPYITGVLKGLNIKYKSDIEKVKNTEDETIIPSSSTPKDVKIALYKWLKAFYDRWLAGLSDYDQFKAVNLVNENDAYMNATNPSPNRFYFIDSYYNKVGHKVLVNMDEFLADTIRSQSTDSNTLMTIYGLMMQKNRLQLFIIPNFLDMSNAKEVESMFRPVPYVEMKHPDEMDCFVGVYCSEPSSKLNIDGSEYDDDSYLITDIEAELPKALTSKNTQTGYRIPAFGVAYGGQYQSYFTDIKVGMDSNMVTEQSIKAQFNIADMGSGRGGGENGRTANYLGQDLYTVYSNNSYTCTLTMMGCAWVRPTMYFALLNVPLFRGTYRVVNVTHQITPGDMTTTITGVRMPKISTPIVNTVITSDTDSMASIQEIIGDIMSSKADIGNDCGYKKYPNYDPTNGTVTESYLTSTMVNDVAPKTKEHFAKTVSLLDALACTLNAEAGNQDQLGQELVATVFYNRWRNSQGSWNQLFQPKQIAFDSKYAKYDHVEQTGKLAQYEDIIKRVFTQTPSCLLEGDRTTTVDKPTVIYENGEPTERTTENVKLTLEMLQKMYMYCTTVGYGPDNTEEYRKTHNGVETHPEYWRKCEYLCHHKGHVFTGGPKGGVPSSLKWKSVVKIDEPERDRNERLFDRLKLTCGHTDSIGGDTLKLNGDSGDEYRTITFGNGKGAKVFDAFATTYYDELSCVQWVINDDNSASASEPSGIRFKAGMDGETGKRSVAMVTKGSYEAYNGDVATMSKNYLTTLSKLYGNQISEAKNRNDATGMPSEIGSIKGGGSTDEERTISAMDAIIESGKNVKDCPVSKTDAVSSIYRNSGNWTWEGSKSSLNSKRVPDGKLGKDFNADAATNGMWDGSSGTIGETFRCASAVRAAMEKGFGGGEFQRPLSACRYSEWMDYYGFELIGEGTIDGSNRPGNNGNESAGPKGYSNGYKPKKGDIIIIAGMNVANDDKRHGHIQIYDGEHWCCDKKYQRIFPYKETGRPYKIYRFPEA